MALDILNYILKNEIFNPFEHKQFMGVGLGGLVTEVQAWVSLMRSKKEMNEYIRIERECVCACHTVLSTPHKTHRLPTRCLAYTTNTVLLFL